MPETLRIVPADQAQRTAALNVARSVLVQAPAGSGKTSLLTQRFLALLGRVNDPSEIVAITFTRAAAAEMRARILGEMERAAASPAPAANADPLSTAVLAHLALERSRELGWNLLDQPTQLRISTIDSFCRELALQQPLVAGLGGTLEVAPQPDVLYRRAARRTLGQLDTAPRSLREAAETLLLWRDNNWAEMESLLVNMLKARDRWMHGFVLDRDPDPDALRSRLERPFVRTVSTTLEALSSRFAGIPDLCEEILALARFACEQTCGAQHLALAEAAELPVAPFADPLALADAQSIYLSLAGFLLTETGFRKSINVTLGFPKERKREKERMLALLASLRSIEGLEQQLLAVRALPPAGYSDDDWRIVQAAFTLLRNTAAALRVVFAEEGATDFTEIAQTALNVLRGEEDLPEEATLALVDGIRHLLVDEFQDTSRRQHELLGRIVAAWPDSEDRTCFVVGDPMQSIYFFREADAELFTRVRDLGLEMPGAEPLALKPLRLVSNFRTAPVLVARLNQSFEAIFADNDGSGIDFAPASPARNSSANASPFHPRMELHIEFLPELPRSATNSQAARDARKTIEKQREEAKASQIDEIVALIRSHYERMECMDRAAGAKYRVAVLGRSRPELKPIAEALRKVEIPFRAVDLEPLRDRPEIIDVLLMARALLNDEDRVAWLGLLRAPWCGLSLTDLHRLTSNDDPQVLARPVPVLIAERATLLSSETRVSAGRVLDAMHQARAQRAASPEATLGTWLRKAWESLSGPLTVDRTASANLDLLWQALDTLPEGEQDLLGPALNTALGSLTAQPDPNVDENFGVQLMTIHKSKGLEFEVVIVPELQARSGKVDTELLAWLERGVTDRNAVEDPTEFLVAPLQTKGADRGGAKAWVDAARREREQQELRRLLYVAATRAREELHLFARPSYKQKDGEVELALPQASLLKTAWPALGREVEERFDAWKTTQQESPEDEEAEDVLFALAAGAESTTAVQKPTRLFRLPAEVAVHRPLDIAPEIQPRSEQAASGLYTRHEGGLRSRTLGTAVHSVFEELARLRESLPWEQACAALAGFTQRAAATVRSAGFERSEAEAIAAEALAISLDASHTPEAAWIFAPHADAASEQRWTSVLNGTLHTVQVDRIFRAGAAPFAAGENVWWIIDLKTVDLKTAHPDEPDPQAAMASLRASFAPQLVAYAQALRNLKGPDIEIRAALYYPRLKALDWWVA